MSEPEGSSPLRERMAELGWTVAGNVVSAAVIWLLLEIGNVVTGDTRVTEIAWMVVTLAVLVWSRTTLASTNFNGYNVRELLGWSAWILIGTGVFAVEMGDPLPRAAWPRLIDVGYRVLFAALAIAGIVGVYREMHRGLHRRRSTRD